MNIKGAVLTGYNEVIRLSTRLSANTGVGGYFILF